MGLNPKQFLRPSHFVLPSRDLPVVVLEEGGGYDYEHYSLGLRVGNSIASILKST